MKIIKLIDGKEYVIEDNEFKALTEVLLMLQGRSRLIQLSNGDIINTNSISHTGEPDSVAYWNGYPLNKDGQSFMRDGKKIYLEPHNLSEIEQLPDLKYKTMIKVKLLK